MIKRSLATWQMSECSRFRFKVPYLFSAAMCRNRCNFLLELGLELSRHPLIH